MINVPSILPVLIPLTTGSISFLLLFWRSVKSKHSQLSSMADRCLSTNKWEGYSFFYRLFFLHSSFGVDLKPEDILFISSCLSFMSKCSLKSTNIPFVLFIFPDNTSFYSTTRSISCALPSTSNYSIVSYIFSVQALSCFFHIAHDDDDDATRVEWK